MEEWSSVNVLKRVGSSLEMILQMDSLVAPMTLLYTFMALLQDIAVTMASY